MGPVGGLRRRLRRGLILSLALNPRNRQKTLGILYPPLLAQRKTTKCQIWTEVCRRGRSQRVALSRMDPRIWVIGLLQAAPPPPRLTKLITSHLSPTPAAPSPNTPQSPNPDQGQTRPRNRSPSHHHLPRPSRSATRIRRLKSSVRVLPSRDRGFSIWRMSCLQGSLDGLEVVMVEDSRSDGSVHPVVASQCQASPVQGTAKGEGGRGRCVFG